MLTAAAVCAGPGRGGPCYERHNGRPAELTAKYAQGADVFVTECQPDLARLNLYKYGLPEFLYSYTIDIHHTVDYAAGYLMKQVNLQRSRPAGPDQAGQRYLRGGRGPGLRAPRVPALLDLKLRQVARRVHIFRAGGWFAEGPNP